jgi:hypothetical protein
LQTAIALSGNGNTLAIGAPFANENTGFVRVVSTLDILEGDLLGVNLNDYFGRSLALSEDGRTLAVGFDNQINGRKG